MDAIGSKKMDAVLGAIKNEKISTGLLGVVLTLAWVAFTWAGDQHANLVPKEQYERDQTELKAQVGQLTTLVSDYIEDSKIVTASQLIRDKELALQVAMATGEPEANVQYIRDEIAEAKKYRSCLIEERPNCKHLKPPE